MNRQYELLYSGKGLNSGWYVLAKDIYDDYLFIHSGPFDEQTARDIFNALDMASRVR